jgi:hypothetical protein
MSARPYRHVRERSHDVKDRLKRSDSRIFDAITLDGVADAVGGEEPARDELGQGRHRLAMAAARRLLERRRRANTAPARMENEPGSRG